MPVAWAEVPYGIITTAPHCQVSGSAAYGLSVAALHEWAEEVTDPQPVVKADPHFPLYHDAWANPGRGTDSGEVADLCENGKPKLARLEPAGDEFMLPALWSNEAASKTGKGNCVFGS